MFNYGVKQGFTYFLWTGTLKCKINFLETHSQKIYDYNNSMIKITK